MSLKHTCLLYPSAIFSQSSSASDKSCKKVEVNCSGDMLVGKTKMLLAFVIDFILLGSLRTSPSTITIAAGSMKAGTFFDTNEIKFAPEKSMSMKLS